MPEMTITIPTKNPSWYTTDNNNTLENARDFFWKTYQSEISARLEAEARNGWKAVSNVGPQGFTIKVKSRFSWLDMFLGWYNSGGRYFIIDILNGGSSYRKVGYEAVNFTVTLRK